MGIRPALHPRNFLWPRVHPGEPDGEVHRAESLHPCPGDHGTSSCHRLHQAPLEHRHLVLDGQ